MLAKLTDEERSAACEEIKRIALKSEDGNDRERTENADVNPSSLFRSLGQNKDDSEDKDDVSPPSRAAFQEEEGSVHHGTEDQKIKSDDGNGHTNSSIEDNTDPTKLGTANGGSKLSETENNMITLLLEKVTILQSKSKLRERQDSLVESKNKLLQSQADALETKNKLLESQDQLIENMTQLLQDKDKLLQSKDNLLKDLGKLPENHTNVNTSKHQVPKATTTTVAKPQGHDAKMVYLSRDSVREPAFGKRSGIMSTAEQLDVLQANTYRGIGLLETLKDLQHDMKLAPDKPTKGESTNQKPRLVQACGTQLIDKSSPSPARSASNALVNRQTARAKPDDDKPIDMSPRRAKHIARRNSFNTVYAKAMALLLGEQSKARPVSDRYENQSSSSEERILTPDSFESDNEEVIAGVKKRSS